MALEGFIPHISCLKIGFRMMRFSLTFHHHGCPRFCVARAIQTKNIDEEAQTVAYMKNSAATSDAVVSAVSVVLCW